jgi:GT2 family glycosyltransferase
MRVAVVILNWNGKRFLQQFLGNVVEHSRPLGRVYVADNDSTDGSLAYVRNQHPEVHIIETGGNLGYAGGYNVALAGLGEEYAVLLNSDVEVTPHWLEPVIRLMDSDPCIGACQPKLMDHADRSRFEYAGACGGFIDPLGFPFCRGRLFNHLEEDAGQYDDAREVFWASGACMFVRLSAFRSAGGLDADFFAHMEEIDLCWRMKRAGHTVWVQPASVVFHVGGGTLHKSNPHKTFLNFRNGLELLTKNLPARALLPVIFMRMILDGIAALHFLSQGHGQDFIAVFRAHVAYYGRIRSTLSKRSGAYPKVSGVLASSIVWRHFASGVKSFSALGWDGR